ncbi:MAG: peptidoglycan editing factor PgeF [Anaerolineae bacterium]
MLRKESGGLVTYRFESLAIEGLVHAVFTRLGGVSRAPFDTLNVGNTVGDDEADVAENHARVYARLGLSAEQMISPRQVHSNRVAVVTDAEAGSIIADTDGLATSTPHVALLLRFADCQPILLYDPVHHALALVHAGWRGVAQGIARRAVETMVETFGTSPGDLLAGLGPAIGPCCYTVGDKVAAAMGYVLPDWSGAMSPLEEGTWRLDLSAANAQQLAAEGVQKIETANLCTSCHYDEFYSHRAGNGRTGRFAAAAFLEVGGEPARVTPTPEAHSQGQLRSPSPPDSLHPPGFPPFGGPLEESV